MIIATIIYKYWNVTYNIQRSGRFENIPGGRCAIPLFWRYLEKINKRGDVSVIRKWDRVHRNILHA